MQVDPNVVETAPEPIVEPTEEPITSEPEVTQEPSPQPDDKPQIPDDYSQKVQKRIDKLTYQAREAERQAAYWKGQAEGKQEPAKPEPVSIPGTAPKPREDDFDTVGEYVEALTDWKANEKKNEWALEQQRKEEEKNLSAVQQSYQEKMAVGYEKYNDFHEVALANTVPINSIMAEVIAGSDNPADIAYYLGSHIHECTTISRMPPMQAARAIGAVEQRLIAAGATVKPTNVNPKNQPPPEPINPVTGRQEIVSKDPNKMSNEEYRQMRMEEQKGR